ncbi:DMT family transporter [Streptomyces sp. NPDC001515]
MVYMSSLALSVLLSLVSAVAYAAGAIVQERVAAASEDGGSLTPLRNRVWWAAVVLNGLGALLHVVALAYGPLSLVQPLGALTIVFALPMAAVFVRRRAGATAWRGAVMATAGLAGLLALTGSADGHALGGPQQLMLAVVTFGAVAALMLLSRAMRRPVVRSVVLAGAAGVAFGIASVFTKTVAMRWTSGQVGEGLPSLLVIAALAGAGLLLSQAAYRGAGLTAPLATVTVVNPVVAAAVGLTLFGEQFRHGTVGTLLALVCGAVAAGGLIMLTTERMGAERAADASAGPSDAGSASSSTLATAIAPGERGDFAGPAGSPVPAGTPSGRPDGPPTAEEPVFPDAVPLPAPQDPRRPAVVLGAVPAPPLRHRLYRVEFGPAPGPGGGAHTSAAPVGSAAGTGDGPGVQTLTPPALR